MNAVVSELLNNFDCTLIVIINLITFFVIKLIDEFNGNKIPTTWQKRTVLIIVCVIVGIFYKYTTKDSINVIINSCIVSPIAWSWLAKPVANKLGIDYKNKYKL